MSGSGRTITAKACERPGGLKLYSARGRLPALPLQTGSHSDPPAEDVSMPFRTFTRTWWLDAACTKPDAGRKRMTGQRYATEAEAREACRSHNLMRYGASMRGPRGLCMEYEEV